MAQMSKFAVTDPASGEILAEYAEATTEAIESALTSTHRAYQEWSRRTTVADRVAHALRLGELFREREDELAEIIRREMGKQTAQSVGEVRFSASIAEAFAKNAERWLAD